MAERLVKWAYGSTEHALNNLCEEIVKKYFLEVKKKVHYVSKTIQVTELLK